jgi:hypothetical protein
MSRPPVFPVQDKVRIVLSIPAGETTIESRGSALHPAPGG